MGPLQHRLHSRVPKWACRHGTVCVNITPTRCRSFIPWMDLVLLRVEVPLEQVSRHVIVTMDASSASWCATCNWQAASGFWTGPRLLWHINCLELLASATSLAAAWLARVVHWQGFLRSRRMSQLARHLLLWSQTQRKSLRAVHILGKLNHAAEGLSRQLTFPGEWRLHPETIRLFWSRFGEGQVNLVVSHESSHGQLYDSLTEAPSARTHWHTAGLGLMQVCASPSEPSRTDIVQGQRGRGTGPAGYAVFGLPVPGFRNSCSS